MVVSYQCAWYVLAHGTDRARDIALQNYSVVVILLVVGALALQVVIVLVLVVVGVYSVLF